MSFSADDFGTRESCVAMPFDMAVGRYLAKQWQLPRMIFLQEGTVYHYTDAGGLLGMISNGRFWATNSIFLNDPTEAKYAVSVIKELVHERSTLSSKEQQLVAAIDDIIDVTHELDLYVVSLSRQGDLLSQWRGYGAFGRGYAVGFALKRLPPHPQNGLLLEVIYGDTELRLVGNDLIDIFFEHLRTDEVFQADDLATWFMRAVGYIAVGFKHPAYAEEEEVRLVFHRTRGEEDRHGASVSFRARGPDLISYIDTGLDLPRPPEERTHLPITKIITGPGVAFVENSQSIQMLLKSNEHVDVEVVASAIPFRP